MRFYMLPTIEAETVCINFEHVAYVRVGAKSIELYFAGMDVPMELAKTATTLSLVAKGMDLSDNSKDLVNAL